MYDKVKIELGEVQKTLLIPLQGRAMEYEEKNPLICDKQAHEIIAKLDFDFDTVSRMPAQVQINCAIRAYNFDAALLKMISQYPDATIVNIGAGLDTTFQRVDNGKIFWYDLDLEDTIALRRQLIPEGDRNKLIAKSVFDRSWFKDIKVRGSNVFFMAAGVLAYLKEEEIKKLFLDILQEFPGSEMMFEIYSRKLLWLKNRSVKRQERSGEIVTRLEWGVNSAKEISKWSDRITIAEEYPFYSKVRMEDHWDKKYLTPLKIVRFFNVIKMVHLKFL